MKRKIMLSSLTIAAAALAVGSGTFASFTDKEESGPMTVTAGTLDLTVGGTAADGFTIANAKPGDSGTENFMLGNIGSLPGTLHVFLVKDADMENLASEVETENGDNANDGQGYGELDSNLTLSFDGLVGLETHLASMAVGDEYELPPYWGTDIPANSPAPPYDNQPSVTWTIPLATTSIIQSDSVGFHFEFVLEQA